jgi:hypothetical protein
VLNTLGYKYNVSEWIKASEMFRESGKLIIELCKIVLKQDKQKASSALTRMADVEEKAYNYLRM